MMKRVYAKHLPYTNGHYGIVFNEMELTDGPTIRVVQFKDKLCAVEGSHRLAACHELGLIPKLIVLDTEHDEMEDHWAKVVEMLPFYDFSDWRIAYEKNMKEKWA